MLQLGMVRAGISISIVVDGSLDRHGGSANVVVLRRLAKVLGVFRLTRSRALVSSRAVAPGCSSTNKNPGTCGGQTSRRRNCP